MHSGRCRLWGSSAAWPLVVGLVVFAAVEGVVQDMPSAGPVLSEHGLDMGTAGAVVTVYVVVDEVVHGVSVDNHRAPPCRYVSSLLAGGLSGVRGGSGGS